jgi:Response regulator containing CheY-like receiver domain and AraC-type DNA-binding domain
LEKTVLIVEDEFLIAMDLQILLETSGWRVMGPAPTVRDALRLLEKERPAVALLDVNLGNELVTEVAEDLRQRSVPFAVASAYERPDLVGGDVLAGAPNVGKPTTATRLLPVLTRLAGLSS